MIDMDDGFEEDYHEPVYDNPYYYEGGVSLRSYHGDRYQKWSNNF